jgi:hypothetical protein
MLTFLLDKADIRRLRVFGVACCRRVWGACAGPGAPAGYRAEEVAAAQAYLDWIESGPDADGPRVWPPGRSGETPTDQEILDRIDNGPYEGPPGTRWPRMPDRCVSAADYALEAFFHATLWLPSQIPVASPHRFRDVAADRRAAGDSAGRAAREARQAAAIAAAGPVPPDGGPPLHGARAAAYHAEGAAQAALLRCLFGNPFRPGPQLDPVWLAWKDGTVARLARSVSEGGAFGLMPVLGDALEDAGCADAALLGHCRSAGPHARGCWVVDLLLAGPPPGG